MKRRRHPGSVLPYLLIAVVSILFAAAQPAYSLAPESSAIALADWSGPPTP